MIDKLRERQDGPLVDPAELDARRQASDFLRIRAAMPWIVIDARSSLPVSEARVVSGEELHRGERLREAVQNLRD